jgi:hypothetical protein
MKDNNDVSECHITKSGHEPPSTGIRTMDVETVQMLVTPGKQDLEDGMELRQGNMAGHQHLTPDEWTDAPEDDTELVDVEWCRSRSHALRIA